MRRMFLAVSGVALGMALAMNVRVGAEQAQDPAAIDKAMKAVGPAFGAIRKAVEAGNVADAKSNAQTLAKAMGDTEAFFKSHGKADGVEMAQAGKKAADAIAAAADIEAMKAPAGEVGKTCAGCHSKYRDKAADGTYTFKPGN
jgi:cytochrome c556